MFETKYIDTSFQAANRTQISSKKNYLSENLWLNSGEKRKKNILLKSYPRIFTSTEIAK